MNRSNIRVLTLAAALMLLLPLWLHVSSAGDDAPLLFINNAPWYRAKQIKYEKIINLYYVPMSVFDALDDVELVEDTRQATMMIRYGNKYFSFDTATGEWAYTEESGQFYLKTYRMYSERYVPVELICEYFGFRYETYENGGKMAMRISNPENTKDIEDILQIYNPSLVKKETTAVTTAPPVIDEPIFGDRTVYLTFEDAPNEYTAEILDTLSKYNCKATFFITGEGALRYPQLIRRMLVEGHSIGLHTMTGAEEYESIDALIDDLDSLNDLLRRITKQRFRLLRLPEGSSATLAALGEDAYDRIAAAGYMIWDWNVDVLDTAKTTANRIGYRAIDGVGYYDIPVLRYHSAELTAASLPILFNYISENEQISVATITVAMPETIPYK
ncbi:MAG: polysaccharide deacetylase family protein [Clostridia bacterium]|nr:polysaccharide deacetylase family protein [Clostridia bacterium]